MRSGPGVENRGEAVISPTESEARGVYAAMEIWTEVRRRVLTGELSKRAACQEYGVGWRTLAKILLHAEPTGYRRRAKREKPILGPHLAWIQEVLEQDKKASKKQLALGTGQSRLRRDCSLRHNCTVIRCIFRSLVLACRAPHFLTGVHRTIYLSC
jgi:hypothetical protein